MSVKMSGVEYKAWQNSDWGEGKYWDGVLLVIDGVETDGCDLETLSDTAVIQLVDGIIMDENDRNFSISAETHFKRWRKAQQTAHLSVEVPKELLAEVEKALKQFKDVRIVAGQTGAISKSADGKADAGSPAPRF